MADRTVVGDWADQWDDEYIPWNDALRGAVRVCDLAAAARTAHDCLAVLQRTRFVLTAMHEDAGFYSDQAKVPAAILRNVEEPAVGLRSDFLRLESSGRRERWDDATVVPPFFFEG